MHPNPTGIKSRWNLNHSPLVICTSVLDSEQQEVHMTAAEKENCELLLLLQFGHNASSLTQNSNRKKQTSVQNRMKADWQPAFEKLCIMNSFESFDESCLFFHHSSGINASAEQGRPFHTNSFPSNQFQRESAHANEPSALLDIDNFDSHLEQNPTVELIRAYFEGI